MYIKFIGAVSGSLTGSCTWLYHAETDVQFLVDCGMFQGEEDSDWKNQQDFPFQPSKIKYVLLTHAHLDHCGLIPKLYNEGFKGKVLTTQATAELATLIMEDAAQIGRVYKRNDVKKVNFEFVDKIEEKRNSLKKISESIYVTFLRNSHILGASSIHISWSSEDESPRSILFTGDIGCNFRGSEYLPLLKANHNPHPLTNYIVIESTYGDKVRDNIFKDEKSRIKAITNILGDTVLKNNGRLIIPAFSLHRTQELVFDFFNILANELHLSEYKDLLGDHIFEEKGEYYRWERVIRIDCISPLAAAITDIYSKYLSIKVPSTKKDIYEIKYKYLNSLALTSLKEEKITSIYSKRYIKEGHVIKQKKEISENFDVVIASSGMGDSGAIRDIIKESISNKNDTILLTGYVSPNSLCGKIKPKMGSDNNIKELIIDGKEYLINAQVVDISNYYSAHADSDMLVNYIFKIDSVNKNNNKLIDTTLFINHGNDNAKEILKEKIKLRATKKNIGERLVSDVHIATKSNWYNLNKSCYEEKFEPNTAIGGNQINIEVLLIELIDTQKKASKDIEIIKQCLLTLSKKV